MKVKQKETMIVGVRTGLGPEAMEAAKTDSVIDEMDELLKILELAEHFHVESYPIEYYTFPHI